VNCYDHECTALSLLPPREREREFYIFSQPTRLYRFARVVGNLVKNITCPESLSWFLGLITCHDCLYSCTKTQFTVAGGHCITGSAVEPFHTTTCSCMVLTCILHAGPPIRQPYVSFADVVLSPRSGEAECTSANRVTLSGHFHLFAALTPFSCKVCCTH